MKDLKTLALALTLGISSFAFAQPISEDFDDIGGTTSNGQAAGANLEAQGWFFFNQSDPEGLTDYFQGNLTVFDPFSTTGYLGTNYNNTGDLGVISNWCMLPERTLSNGDVLTFYTRTVSATYPDRLQVRMSLNGASTNTGTGAYGLGDFTNLLLDINPNYIGADYPQVWTQFTITLSGLSGPTSGRLAFRYFVEDAGLFGLNSNYIGIDELRYTPAAADATVTGSVNLQDIDGDEEGKSATIEIRQGGNVVDTEVVTLGPGGSYSFSTTVTGSVDISCKGATWLRQTLTGQTLTAGSSTTADFDLTNGDCDDDNEVTLVDFGILSATFGKAEGDAGYDARGDLNCDNEVNLVDAGILSAKFGQAGDE